MSNWVFIVMFESKKHNRVIPVLVLTTSLMYMKKIFVLFLKLNFLKCLILFPLI